MPPAMSGPCGRQTGGVLIERDLDCGRLYHDKRGELIDLARAMSDVELDTLLEGRPTDARPADGRTDDVETPPVHEARRAPA